MIKYTYITNFNYKKPIMNATPNINNWLVNIDAIALETKKLEAKKEILQNIQDFAILFQRIQEAANMDEFNRIVSEEPETDRIVSEEPKTVWNNTNISNIPVSDFDSEYIKSEDVSEAKNIDLEVWAPKIKLNLWSIWKSANDDNYDEEQKAA